VTSESRASTYSPGTVSVNRVQRVDQQGPIQQTASSTDAAISGNGMFVVKRSADDLQEFLYTRSGQFSEDSQGLLRNTANFVLYGWPLDSDNNLPSNQGDLTSLVPVDVAFLGGLTRPTSNAELSINLDSETVDDTLTEALTSAPDFSRGITVYDSLGVAQNITLEYHKVYGPEGTFAGTVGDLLATDNLVTDLGLTEGDTFDVSFDGGAAIRYEIDNDSAIAGTSDVGVQTINDIISDINSNPALTGVEAFLGNDGELVIQRTDFAELVAPPPPHSVTLENTFGTPLTGLGITLVNGGGLGPDTMTSDDLTGGAYDNGAPGDSPPYSTGNTTTGNTFPTPQFLPGDAQYNNRGWWQLNIIHPDGTSISNGLLNFNGDGSLNALPDSDGDIDINLSQIDWGNGSEPQNIDLDVERFSQFAGNFDVIFSDQNGAELGLRTGVEISREGIVSARFSNGATADLYKLPLVTFANANGLQEVSGTAYTETEESGEENLREAGRGGAGFLEPSTVEASNVDLADEFAKLIVSQRAYSANTRVINTVDQMTEDLLRLR